MPTPLHHLTHLRRATSGNLRAPHKPILLLAVMEAYRTALLTTNEIRISPELVALFKQIWAQLVITPHHPNMSYPFYHMQSEGFWTLIPKADVQVIKLLGAKAKNLATLDAAIEYASISNEMAGWMMDSVKRAILEEAVLATYFPETRHNFQPTREVPNIVDDIGTELLETPAYQYKEAAKIWMAAEDGEEIYLRSATFKRLIPQVYTYTCAVTRWRITTIADDQMIDACHIIPFCDSHDDTISNGIALSPTLHRAFDRGLIAISDDYKVMVKHSIQENESPHALHHLKERSILLPGNKLHHPSIDNLRSHRKRHDFS